MKRRRPAGGQQRLFGKKKLDVKGKPLGVRKLIDVCPGWKRDIVVLGRYQRIPKLSEEVRLSVCNRMFLELFENDEVVDCEELWNRYYAKVRIEMTPSAMKLMLEDLLRVGLIRIDAI